MSTAHKSRANKPCEPIAKSKPTRGSPKKSSSSGHNSNTSISITEVDAKRSKRSAASSSTQVSLKEHLKRDTSSSDGKGKLEDRDLTDTTAYWNEQLQAQLFSRKKDVVDRFMAVIAECLDRKLEPFEEPCDGEACAASSSRGSSKSSACKKGGSSKRQTIGKRRQYERDDDGHESENDDGDRRNDNNKRSKTVPEDKLLYACPYLKYAPEIYGKKRTCSGPGWHDPHRVKEHLKRSHQLPEFRCPRCWEAFAKEELMTTHLRADEPCVKRQPLRQGARDLADGFNKDQADRLLKRGSGPGHEKWINWYCILFNEDPNSPNLPSPYQGVSADSNWMEGHTHRSKYGDYIAVLRRETLKRIEALFETELNKALHGVQPKIRRNVLDRIPSLADSVSRVVQSGPEYSGSRTGDGQTLPFAIPPNLDTSKLFDSNTFLPSTSFLDGLDANNFGQHDAFNFNTLDYQDTNQCQGYQPHEDYSSSYQSDDLLGTTHSSNTSVEENYSHNTKTQGQQRTTMLPQQLALPLSDSYAQQPYY